MTKNLITVMWDSTMEYASEKMATQKIRHLPVTDHDGTVIGIISDRDVKRAMDPQKPGFACGNLVREYMHWPVITVEENHPLERVVATMVEKKISAVLVTAQGGRVMGIVTSQDLLRLLDRLLNGVDKRPIARSDDSTLIGEFLREIQPAGL